jgi:hypothetical protein
MNEHELHERFLDLDFELPHTSIKRWSRQGLLPKPALSTSRGTGGGRGRIADWPEETVEQAAAIYAIRNQGYSGLKRRIVPHTISTIRSFANTFFKSLEDYRTNVNDPLLDDFSNRFFTMVDVKVPSAYVQDTDTKNDKGEVWKWRSVLFDEAHEAHAVKWITAVEKVALGVPVTTSVTISCYFGRVEHEQLASEENTLIPLCYLLSVAAKSKIDKVEVIAQESKLKELPRLVAEDDALLGVKLQDEVWLKVVDTEQPNDLVHKVKASIPLFADDLVLGGGTA